MTNKNSTLLKLNENLNILKEREAKYSGNAPLDLLNQIDDHEQAIDLTRQAITGEISEQEWKDALKPLLLAINNDSVVNINQSGQTVLGDQYNAGGDQHFYIQQPTEERLFSDPFPRFAREKRQSFVGREFVFNKWYEFIENNPSGYFQIIGEPGAGKSTILAELVHREGYISHFNSRANGINTTRHFIESIAKQIIDRYELSINIPALPARDGIFLDDLINKASLTATKNAPLVIVIDALDEVNTEGHPSGSNILFLPNTLPQYVYMIFTRRPMQAASLPSIEREGSIDLDSEKHFDDSKRDIQMKIQQDLENRVRLRNWVQERQLTETKFLEIMVEKSQNNFMYIHHIIPDIENGFYESLEIEALPTGLKNYYEDHWYRMGMATSPRPKVKLRIIYVLGYIKKPASPELLARFAQTDQTDIDIDEMLISVLGVLAEWKQFLHLEVMPTYKQYSLYHDSFRDFLFRKDIVEASGLAVDLDSLQEHMANRMMGTFRRSYPSKSVSPLQSIINRIKSLFR